VTSTTSVIGKDIGSLVYEMPTYGSMTDSPHTSPRSAQEQTLGAVMSGPGQDIYGPVPVHPIGQGWSPDATQGVRRPSSTQSPYGQASTPSLNNDELVLVTNNQLMTDTSEFGSSVGALTSFDHQLVVEGSTGAPKVTAWAPGWMF
jgi:hypothetical protein